MIKTPSDQDDFWAVSDLHLHPSRPEAIEHFRSFLKEARRNTSHLVILGDLFDYWIGPYDFHRDEFSGVFRALKRASRNGLDLSFVAGNRDFLVRDDLTGRMAIDTFRDRWETHRGDTGWIGVHGDTLCHHDTTYQFYRRLIQTRLVGDAIKQLPGCLKSKLIRDLRNVSRAKIAEMEEGGQNLSLYRIRSLLREGVQHLICGHVHEPGHHRIQVGDRTKSLWVLGDWIVPEDCTFFIGRAGSSRLARF